MKLITFNVNGVRSALKKGLAEWIRAENADIICLQEIKLSETEIVEPIFTEMGYNCYWYPAIKKGYSGVAVLTKIIALEIIKGFGIEPYDNEGRTILAKFQNFDLLCAYFPSGTTGELRQKIKMKFLEDFYNYSYQIKSQGIPLLICGDVNICHTEIDIHNPKSNTKTSGFLPEERSWVSKFIESGFLDTFRFKNKESHQYTWWSYRAGSREKNLGWRIDYIFATNLDTNVINNVQIHNEVIMSDHCPVSIEINI